MTDYPWAYVGAKVICVDADVEAGPKFERLGDALVYRGATGLRYGDIYTITHVRVHPIFGSVVIVLAEVDRGLDPDGYPCGHNILRFRSLHTIESDAELFRAALNPTTDDIVYENALILLDEAERELEDAWKNGR